jgi:type II restriction enzyme
MSFQSMPFRTRFLGKDTTALFSFIRSLNANFGTTIFEPVGLELAKVIFKITEKRPTAGTQISDDAQREIQNIIDEISAASVKPSKVEEIERIRKVRRRGKMHKVKLTKIAIYLEKTNRGNFCLILKP